MVASAVMNTSMGEPAKSTTPRADNPPRLMSSSSAKERRRLQLLRGAWTQGLTLVHYSAQNEPFLTQKHTLNTPNTPYHPLNTPETTPKRTP